MLTRLRLKRDFRVVVRYVSDKPSDGDGTKTEEQPKTAKETEKKSDSSMSKIQALLKSMKSEPLSREAEYRANFASAPDVRRQRKNDEIEVKVEKIEESIVKAAGDVAQAIGGDVKQTEADLLSKVLGKIDQKSTKLSDLLIGMKVERSDGEDRAKNYQETRGEQVKRHFRPIGQAKVAQIQKTQQSRPQQDKDQRRVRTPTESKGKYMYRQTEERFAYLDDCPKKGVFSYMQTGFQNVSRDRDRGSTYKSRDTRESIDASVFQSTTVDIFGGVPLNIFKGDETNHGTKLRVWESLKQREVSLATSQQPANYFQKMILWTEQGKVWKFPIDNEQGLEEEVNVHFSEHIFLDTHLEGWCPKKGPIRHFMELVCVGLSKNPFYTAQEKKDHIMWYKEYFESKKDVLTDVGAWDVEKSNNEASA